MKKKRLLTVAFSLVALFSLNAQTNWKPGYIIYPTGDTIHGSLLYKENRNVSKFCDFKTINGENKQLLPTEITGYRFDEGKFYISKVIKGVANDEPVFVEFMIQGKVSLYRYNDGNDRYFAQKDTVIQELKNTTATQYIESKNEYYSIQKNEYIGTLGFLFQDANMQAQVNSCEYRPKSMIKLAKTYHETVCTDEKCIIYERSVKPLRVVWGIHGGVNYGRYNYGGMMEAGYEPNFVLGCRIEFQNFVDLKEKLSFVIDFDLQKSGSYTWTAIDDNYTDLKYNGQDYRVTNHSNSLTSVDELTVDFKSVALKVPLTFNYLLSTSDIQPYLGVGLMNVLVLTQNKNLEVHPRGTSYDNYTKLLPTYQIGFVGKIGTKILIANNHSLFAECSYEYINGLETNEFQRMKTNGFSLILGYNF
jgi:hypothetical protein